MSIVMSTTESTAAVTEPPTPPDNSDDGGPKLVGRLLETIQVFDEHYKVVDGASSIASDVLEKFPSAAEYLGSSYTLAKEKLVPESYKETVDTVEKEIRGLDKEALSVHAENIDNKIAETLQAVQDGKRAVQDKIAETQDKIVSAASERAMYGLESVESGVDYVLPDDTETSGGEDATDGSSTEPKTDAAKEDQADANKPLLNKAMGISKKTQRKLQKKAFEGLGDLRFRPVQLGAAVDLIQYNRFLDVRSVLEERAGVAKTVLDENVVKAWEVLESSEFVVKVKPVLENLEGKAGDAITKIKTVIVEPAREFYTTVMVEFVKDPSQAAKEFRTNVEKAVGPEWTKSLETPTMELWELMTGLYQKMERPPAGSDMEAWKQTLVANVGTLLDLAWTTAASTPSESASDTAATETRVATDVAAPSISAPTPSPVKTEEVIDATDAVHTPPTGVDEGHPVTPSSDCAIQTAEPNDCEGLITSEFFADLHHREDASVTSSEKSTSSERQVSMAEFVSRSRSQKK